MGEGERLEQLEVELGSAIARDGRYWLQNAAKFRAVAQGASYEQFEELVATSHLAPTARADMVGRAEARRGLWNTVAGGRKVAQGEEIVVEAPPPAPSAPPAPTAPPATLQQFQRAWSAGGAEERRALLAALGEPGLRRLFPTDVPTDLLDQVVLLFLGDESEVARELAVEALGALAAASRFHLCLTFLGPGQRERLGVLLVGLGARGEHIRATISL